MDAVIGIGPAELLDDGLFRSPVHFADVIVSFFLADGQDIQPFHGAIDQFSGAARGAQGDVQHGLHTGASLEWKYEKPEIIAELAQDMKKTIVVSGGWILVRCRALPPVVDCWSVRVLYHSRGPGQCRSSRQHRRRSESHERHGAEPAAPARPPVSPRRRSHRPALERD